MDFQKSNKIDFDNLSDYEDENESEEEMVEEELDQEEEEKEEGNNNNEEQETMGERIKVTGLTIKNWSQRLQVSSILIFKNILFFILRKFFP